MNTNDQTAKKIMVIDDEAIVGKRLRQVLEKMGFQVEIETNAIPAMKRIEQNRFDVVVTDLKMREMDGMQVLRQINQTSPQTKVIIITGYAEPGTSKDAFQQGVFEFITKPFRLDEIKSAILRALKDGK